jgi:predicted RNA-binding Zn-ribbon protein involved in translation (DUF1610 family)
MFDRNRPHKLTDVRGALNSDGEVWVGTMATRRWWGRTALAGTGLLLAVAAVWVYVLLRPANEADGYSATPRVKVRCTNQDCRHADDVRVKSGQTFPLICPKCGQHTWSEVWRCTKCKREFVPMPTGTSIQCPKCGSTSVGAASVTSP